MNQPSLTAQRARLSADYAAARKAHRPRIAVVQQLKRATTRQLAFEVAADLRAAERAKKAARAAAQPSLLADLDILCSR